MMIEFPKEEENFSPQDAYISHKYLADYHLHFMKLQSECEFFYWKLAGFFFFSLIGAFILHDKGILLSPFGTITIIGCGFLLIFAQNVKSDLEYTIGIASCLEKGLAIEKKYNYPARLFKIFEENKNLTYKSNLLSRSVPFFVIATSTLIAGIGLAENIGRWLSVIIVVSSVFVLFIAMRFYVKKIGRIILGK